MLKKKIVVDSISKIKIFGLYKKQLRQKLLKMNKLIKKNCIKSSYFLLKNYSYQKIQYI
jgi:hypothetical protein